MIEKRKTSNHRSAFLPSDYLKAIEEVFNKNFKDQLLVDGKHKEHFVTFGEIFPDEIVLAICLKNPATLRMTTCYASIDYLSAQSNPDGVAKEVQGFVNHCIDAAASFFHTFFVEDRPVDYDSEYRQTWTEIVVDTKTKVFVKINRDNLELESMADRLLREDEEAKLSKKKNSMH